MSLPDDLLKQARLLAELDPRRPKQANLRRSTSSAYYSLFHLLVADATQRMSPVRPATLAAKMRRAFQHGDMKQACLLFRTKPTSPKIEALLGAPVSDRLRSVARSFVLLQEARHSADYDLAVRPTRATALDSVAEAETAFGLWKQVRASDEANAFLAALAFGSRWDR